MTRDLKNISESNKKTGKKTAKKKSINEMPKKGLPVWFWLVSGITIGTFFSFLVYLKLNIDVNDNSQKVVEEKIVVKPSRSVTIEDEGEITEKSRFEFYKILSNRNIEIQVEPPENAKKEIVNTESVTKKVINEPAIHKEAPTKKVQNSRLYILQAGSFSRFKDADTRKANLALMGVRSKIHAISRTNKTMYRVQVGPYRNLAKINEVASTLKRNKIPSLLMKVKG